MNINSDIINSNNGKIKQELKFHYFWYLVIFLIIYLISLLIPTLIFILYMTFFLIPHFLQIPNFVSLFTELKSLIGLLTFPFCIIFCYMVRLFFIAFITRGFWRFTEKKSPSRSGIISRNMPSKALTFYHFRSFIIKYPKNFVVKGLFPWLTNWFLNFIGSNKIGKGTTIEESGGNEKFSIIGNNCYIGVDTVLATHLVEGILGNIAYFQIKVGDNVTTGGLNQIGPGTEIHDNSYLLPLASSPKHNTVKGNNYYFGLPLRKIFNKKIMEYLKINPGYITHEQKIKDNIEMINKELLKSNNIEETNGKDDLNGLKNSDDPDLKIDFTTSSAISKINLKFIILYLPIFWLSGLMVSLVFYSYTIVFKNIFMLIFFCPAILIIMHFIFILGCFLFSKLFLTLINLIHIPKEGIFPAKKSNPDFKFWCLRVELKKLVLWLVRNWPLPWMDILIFKWFGIKMKFSSTLYDSWSDTEFIKIGHNVLVGQQSVIMSSMIIGKYLIIKRVIFDNYTVIGGHTSIAPGTVVGQNSVVGALTTTTYNQILDPGWVYLGTPARKLKQNKHSGERQEEIVRKDKDN